MLSDIKSQRAWAEISKSALENNISSTRKYLNNDTKLLAVVKADCYGHSSDICVPVFYESGVDMFAVATLDEAIEITKYTKEKSILILGSLSGEQAFEAIKRGFVLTLASLDSANEYNEMAEQLGKKARIHIKIDTGMSRLGFRLNTKKDLSIAYDNIIKIFDLENINVEGIFTHFAISDDMSDNFTREQFMRFSGITDKLLENGYNIGLRHCSNSAAIINYPEYQMDMVRAGIMLYGLDPSDTTYDDALMPVMRVCAKVTGIKEIEKEQSVSYVRKFIADKRMKIATISVGYADGLHASFAKGAVTINNKRAKILGRICMDQLMVDVSDINVRIGDTAYIISSDPGQSADDAAVIYDSINYEVVCGFTKRIKRILCQ